MRTLLLAVAMLTTALPALAQQGFDVVSIHLTSGSVQFERDGETTLTRDTLRMRDVTVSTCIKLAYGLQQSQIIAPEGMDGQHYDIVAKTDTPVSPAALRAMLQSLLADRFALRMHSGSREMEAEVLTVAPQGLKMKASAEPDGEPSHQNSAMGMVAHNFTMKDLADYVSGPLGTLLLDETHQPGRYDFTLDFRPYVDDAPEIHANPQAVLRAVFQGELGLHMARRRVTVATVVIDHVSAPQEN